MSGDERRERCATCDGELDPEDTHRLDEGGARVCNHCWGNPLAVTHYTAEHLDFWRKMTDRPDFHGDPTLRDTAPPFDVKVDPSLPPGEVELRQGDRVVGRMVNVGTQTPGAPPIAHFPPCPVCGTPAHEPPAMPANRGDHMEYVQVARCPSCGASYTRAEGEAARSADGATVSAATAWAMTQPDGPILGAEAVQAFKARQRAEGEAAAAGRATGTAGATNPYDVVVSHGRYGEPFTYGAIMAGMAAPFGPHRPLATGGAECNPDGTVSVPLEALMSAADIERFRAAIRQESVDDPAAALPRPTCSWPPSFEARQDAVAARLLRRPLAERNVTVFFPTPSDAEADAGEPLPPPTERLRFLPFAELKRLVETDPDATRALAEREEWARRLLSRVNPPDGQPGFRVGLREPPAERPDLREGEPASPTLRAAVEDVLDDLIESFNSGDHEGACDRSIKALVAARDAEEDAAPSPWRKPPAPPEASTVWLRFGPVEMAERPWLRRPRFLASVLDGSYSPIGMDVTAAWEPLPAVYEWAPCDPPEE